MSKGIVGGRAVAATVLAVALCFPAYGPIGSARADEPAEASDVESDRSEPVIEEAPTVSAELAAALAEGEGPFDVMVLFKAEASLEEAVEGTASSPDGSSKSLRDRKAVVGALQETATLTQDGVASWLEEEKNAGNVESYERFYIVNAMHVVANAQVVRELAANPRVDRVDLNHVIKGSDPIVNRRFNLLELLPVPRQEVEWNIDRIGADDVWSRYGVTGTGVTVGVIDSAVDAQHAALKSKFRGFDPKSGDMTYEGNYLDCVSSTTRPEEARGSSHGTHVAGTIVGSETDAEGRTFNAVGTAPGANWINARVFDDSNYTNDAALLRAAEWMLKPGGDVSKAPAIVNNSWGGSDGSNTWYQKSVAAWRAAHILPVFAAGNKLPGEQDPGPGSIIAPASYTDSFSVAAVDKDGKLPAFSKRGPSPLAGNAVIKPEVSAPGVEVRSCVRGGYEYMSGTSMAAPHVSGSAALIKAAQPNLDDRQIEKILEETATGLTDATYPGVPNMGYGYGCIDAYDAVSKALGTAVETMKGKVTCGGKPVDTEVSIKETGQTAHTDAATGEFVLKHAAGTYTLVCDTYGYGRVEQSVTIGGEGSGETVVELSKKHVGSIKATVVSAEGTPLSGVHARVIEGNDSTVYESSDQGLFSIAGLPVGTYTLRLFKEGLEPVERQVEVREGSNEQRFEMSPSAPSIETVIKHDNGRMNQSLTGNVTIGSGSYSGCAVCFVPYKKGGVIADATVSFSGTRSGLSTKAKLSILQKDNRGRTETLLGPLDIEVQPGRTLTVPLEEYQVKTDQPYYIAITVSGQGEDPFTVGADETGDSSFSYLYSGKNLVPVTAENIDSALMIRSKMRYPAGSEDLSFAVGKPVVRPIKPTEKAICGKAAPNQKLLFVVAGRKILGQADGSGAFSVPLPADMTLVPGTEVECFGKDANGLLSDKTVAMVVTNRFAIDSAVAAARELLGGGKLNAAQKARLERSVEEAGTLLDEVDRYEASLELDGTVVSDYQTKIDRHAVAVRQTILDFSPLKRELLSEIEESQADLDSVVRSTTGADVPRSRYWVDPGAWAVFSNRLLLAKAKYESILASDDAVEAAIRRLRSDRAAFDARKTPGTAPGEADDEALKPLSRMIERAQAALAGAESSEDGSGLGESKRWAPAEAHAKLGRALEQARKDSARKGLSAEDIVRSASSLKAAIEEFESQVRTVLPYDRDEVSSKLRDEVWAAKTLLYDTRSRSSARPFALPAFEQPVSSEVGQAIARSFDPESVLAPSSEDRAAFIRAIDAAQAIVDDDSATATTMVRQTEELSKATAAYRRFSASS
ncbi:S8 family serine peptidase [Berryella wangjianweii]|uniref:S8 family serine peptidase n=1 Tax=Berryella wangjianweii TaxID=2734634 RepID=A0A6M8J1B7_9ACTN|nr:S8 family serine peptidase [Berryella wangjianweii]QKF07314.1 S8 family serine peptidase [Berryella wangjianweii]